MMLQKFFVLLSSLLFFATPIPILAQDSSADDLDSAITACLSSPDEVACLSQLVLSSGEVRACFAASIPLACSQSVMDVAAPACEAQENPQECFLTLGNDGLEAACTYLDPANQTICFVMGAAESGDYSVVDRRFEDVDARDQAYALLAITAYDPSVLDEIEDNQKYDLASIYVMGVIAVGRGEVFPDDYCSRLRGNYGGEYPDDAALNATLCNEILAFAKLIQNVDTDEREQLIADILAALETDQTGDTLLALVDKLLNEDDTAIIDVGYGNEWCVRHAHDLENCAVMVHIFHDLKAQTIQEGGGRIYVYEGDNRYSFTFERERRQLEGTITETVTEYYVVVSETEIDRWRMFRNNFEYQIDKITRDNE